MADVKIIDLPAASTLADADVFAISQGAATKKVAFSLVSSEVTDAVQAQVIDQADYTEAAPLSASQVTFADTTGLFAGEPLRITQAAVDKYYLITAVVANTSITVAGPPLTLATVIDAIAKLDPSRVEQVDFFMPGLYEVGGATATLLARETRSPFIWNRSRAYCVYAAVAHNTPDGGTEPDVNIRIDGTNVLTTDITLSGSADTWVAAADGDGVFADYLITFGDAIEVDLVAAAGDLDARDLTVSIILILE